MLSNFDLKQPIIPTSPLQKTLIKMYSATISNLFIMQKQRKALWEQKKGFTAVMSLAFARDSVYCYVSYKIKYS